MRDLIDEKVIYPSKLESESGPLLQMPSSSNVTTNNSEADSFFINKKAKPLNQPNETISQMPSTYNSSSSNVTANNSEADSFFINKKAKNLNQPNETKFDSISQFPFTNNSSSLKNITEPILISEITNKSSEADSFLIHKNSKTLNQSNQTKSNSLSNLPSMNNSSSSNVTATQPILISELISEFSDGDSFLKNKKLKTLNQTNQIKFGSLLNFSSTNNSSSSNVTTTEPILINDSTGHSLEGDPLLNNKSANTLNQINDQNLNQNLDSDPCTLQVEIDKLKKDPYEKNFTHIHDLDVITIYIYY
jgi:hypothetical protein